MTLSNAIAAASLAALTALAAGCNRHDTPTGAPGESSRTSQPADTPSGGGTSPAPGAPPTPATGTSVGGAATNGAPASPTTMNDSPGSATGRVNSSPGASGDGVPASPPALPPASAASQ